nr:YegP family protein [Dawidia soli]
MFTGSDKQIYFRLRAANGEPILASEGYTSTSACTEGIDSVKRNAPYDERYKRTDATRNYRFNLTAANGRIIGRSEGYETSAAREDGIAAVKRTAPDAPTEDITT